MTGENMVERKSKINFKEAVSIRPAKGKGDPAGKTP